MKKIWKKIVSIALVTVILNCSYVMNVFAAEDTVLKVVDIEANVIGYNEGVSVGMRSTTFIDTSILISGSSAGMAVTIDTRMNDTASIVGVKDIKVQLKSGNDWITVATSTGGEVSGYAGCSVSFTYSGAVKGKTYKICCTHYGNVDGYRELYHETDEFVFTY